MSLKNFQHISSPLPLTAPQSLAIWPRLLSWTVSAYFRVCAYHPANSGCALGFCHVPYTLMHRFCGIACHVALLAFPAFEVVFPHAPYEPDLLTWLDDLRYAPTARALSYGYVCSVVDTLPDPYYVCSP